MEEWVVANELTEFEKSRLARYVTAVLPAEKRQPLPGTLWHYTTAEGLLGILEHGELFASHVSCLNDSMEHLYLTKVMRKRLRARLPEAEGDLKRLYDGLRANAKARTTEADSAFAASFTSSKDDLAQWRGYGGGECGFAIGFDSKRLAAAIAAKPQRALLRMRYERHEHNSLADTILDQIAEAYSETSSSGEHLSQAYFNEYRDFVEWVGAMVKHPKFRDEREWRLFTRLDPADELFFRSKKTMLARHIKVQLRVDGKLPITRVMVGPAASQSVSRVSVADALKKWCYDDVAVEISKVPYRVP